MEKNSGFTIVIPAYNESSSIVSTILEIENLSGEFEIIVVDDGSTDGTFELAMKTGVNVLRHIGNKGYGASLKTGIRNAKYDKIVITDADGTYPNEKIPDLVKIFENENYDMVVGARIGKNVHIPLIRRPAKWLITKLASFLSKVKIPDLNSGLRVMKKNVVERYIYLLPDGFSFTSTITLAMLTNAYNVKYVPINYFKREGKSKIKPIQDTLNFIQLIIRMALYFNPLKVFIPLSLLLIICAFLVLIGSWFVLGKPIDVTFGVILMAAVMVMAIGMLADLIDKRVR